MNCPLISWSPLRSLARFILFAGVGTLAASGQFSPYLPAEGRTDVTLSQTFVTFDAFWAGKTRLGTRAALGSSGKDQHTTLLSIERGLADRWAVDLTVGYTRVSMNAFSSDQGLTDTQAGVRYVLTDELESFNRAMPTLAIRVGGMLAGTYDEGVPFSAGDGASGLEASVLLGKALSQRVTAFADLGYRWRNQDVPEEIFGSFGLAGRWDSVIVSAAWRYEGAVSGLDILGPGFDTVGGFPQTRERNSTLQGSVGLPLGERYFAQLYVARTLRGENTGDKRIFGVSVTRSL